MLPYIPKPEHCTFCSHSDKAGLKLYYDPKDGKFLWVDSRCEWVCKARDIEPVTVGRFQGEPEHEANK